MDKPDEKKETVDYSRRYWMVCTALEFTKLGLWIMWLYGTRR